jgi:hypothetical protein
MASRAVYQVDDPNPSPDGLIEQVIPLTINPPLHHNMKKSYPKGIDLLVVKSPEMVQTLEKISM